MLDGLKRNEIDAVVGRGRETACCSHGLVKAQYRKAYACCSTCCPGQLLSFFQCDLTLMPIKQSGCCSDDLLQNTCSTCTRFSFLVQTSADSTKICFQVG